jgi:hypothetical protein
LQAELLEHHVEGAKFATMTPEHALDVEGRSAEALGYGNHLAGFDEHDDGIRIDKAPDQPRAGDAIDFGPLARNPERAAFAVVFREMSGRDQWQAGIAPGNEAAFEYLGANALVAQVGGEALADFRTLVADDRERATVKLVRAACEFRVPAETAGNESGVSREIFLGANIDNERRLRRADQTGQFIGCDRMD